MIRLHNRIFRWRIVNKFMIDNFEPLQTNLRRFDLPVQSIILMNDRLKITHILTRMAVVRILTLILILISYLVFIIWLRITGEDARIPQNRLRNCSIRLMLLGNSRLIVFTLMDLAMQG